MHQKTKQAWEQYQDGAITYIEFLFYAWKETTQQDVDEYNVFIKTPVSLNMFREDEIRGSGS